MKYIYYWIAPWCSGQAWGALEHALQSIERASAVKKPPDPGSNPGGATNYLEYGKLWIIQKAL